MADAGRYIFRASRDTHAQITRLFDFVHPAAIAMWNLRWQVQGFIGSVPEASSKDLQDRFALGSNLSAGSIKRATVTITWEQQLEQFASIILINAIASFEDFTANLAKIRFSDRTNQRRLSDALQFPASGKKGRALAMSMVGNPSQVLRGNVTWDNSIAKKFVPNTIDDLLTCYRYFKEIRNSIAHNGGRATDNAKNAYNNFISAINNGLIGGANIPEHSAINAIGDPVKITYRGVIGFSDIIFRILIAYENDLCGMEIAEQEMINRVQPNLGVWPADNWKRHRRLKKMLRDAGFPDITITRDLWAFMARSTLIPAHVL